VEEEFLLVDPHTQKLKPVSLQAVQRAHTADAADADRVVDPVEQELFRPQIETATTPCTDLADIRRELVRGRELVCNGAAAAGAAAIAVPTAVLADNDPLTTAKPRYQRIVDDFGEIGRRNIVCGMHVHVGVDSDDEGVGVIDHLRPWLPVLLAISANSPYYWGNDTGHASWRSQMWTRWPSAGPADVFGDPATYFRSMEQVIATGAAFDRGMIYYGARLAEDYPTVEIRVADVCTELDDAVLVAALTRGAAAAAAQEWSEGRPPPHWRNELLRSATWRASRFGVGGQLVHPLTRALASARDVVAALIDFAGTSLDEAGDRGLVHDLFERLVSRGAGAARQRSVYEATGSLEAVVADLRERTSASHHPA
jgi:glutamate---cysteine ligase / carboxylate-amine ligase